VIETKEALMNSKNPSLTSMRTTIYLTIIFINAIIETVCAGESGKGFVIAAGGIGKPTEYPDAQSKTIVGIFKKIKGAIDKAAKPVDGRLERSEA
jgi:hypothetical protein